MPIVRILEARVFLYSAGICEVNLISLGHQQINQPVPVVCRLDTWSNKTIAGMKGDWKVEVLDSTGAVIKTASFKVQ